MNLNPTTPTDVRQVLEQHVPQAAVAYCLSLWQQYGFCFKISRQRRTKQGDYRYDKARQKHLITVNNNLNPYAFLITYVHEVAHLIAFQTHGFRTTPHGKAWKHSFRQLMAPMLSVEVFPDNVLETLNRHMRDPKAATCSDAALVAALQTHDSADGLVALSEVPVHQTFRFGKRIFLKEKIKRTRAWCREVQTGKCYTIAVSARVAVLQ